MKRMFLPLIAVLVPVCATHANGERNRADRPATEDHERDETSRRARRHYDSDHGAGYQQTSPSEPFLSPCLSQVLPVQSITRGTSGPTSEKRVFSSKGFMPPYLLHIRNGNLDGSKRVSSARVRLNDSQILGPSDFSPHVSGYDLPVTLMDDSKLEVRVDGKPGSFLRIWIVGASATVLPYETLTIAPEGGIYRFPSGVVFQVPPGAVAQETTISACLAEESLVEPVLQSSGTSPKYFAGGFEALPDGLIFDVPITATIPVRPIKGSGDIPLLYALDMERGIYSVADTQLSYDPDTSTISVQIPHFTGWAVAFADAREANCKQNPSDCRCGRFRVETVDSDYSIADQCYERLDVGVVSYFDCGTEETWTFREWVKPKIDIAPGSMTLLLSETAPLTATVLTAEGQPLTFATVSWEADPEVSVNPTAGATTWVTGQELTSVGARVVAKTGCDTRETALVKVTVDGDFAGKIVASGLVGEGCCEWAVREEYDVTAYLLHGEAQMSLVGSMTVDLHHWGPGCLCGPGATFPASHMLALTVDGANLTGSSSFSPLIDPSACTGTVNAVAGRLGLAGTYSSAWSNPKAGSYSSSFSLPRVNVGGLR